MFSVFFILGQTAVGKSEVAYQVAKQSGAMILCMDSMQVYRGLDIGVGKPTREEREQIEHGGIDLIEIDGEFDVASYLRVAQDFIKNAKERQKPVVIVGGTGLYYQALTRGFAPIPEVDPQIRRALEKKTLPELQEDLKKIDPDLSVEIDIHNPRRLIRALEVIQGTGVSLREWKNRNQPPLISEFQAVFLKRENLRERLNQRTTQMIQNGWIEEVESLRHRWGDEIVQKVPAIGYSTWLEVLKGKKTKEEAQEEIQRATWQYARRQLTWFRKESNYETLNLGNQSSTSIAQDLVIRPFFADFISSFSFRKNSCS